MGWYNIKMRKTRLIFIIFILFFLTINLSYCRADSTVNISVTATVQDAGQDPGPGPETPSGGGGGAAIVISPGKVILKGRAYPNAFLTILKNGKVAATLFAEKSGLFEKELTGVRAGVYTFGIFAEDSEARQSITLSFTVSVLAQMTTTISGIFISPTIALTSTQVEKGNIVDILGQAFPESQVNIFISSEETIKTTDASENGKWSYKLNTGFLEEAEHKARAKAVFGEGEQSPFSQTLSFLVVSPGALVCQGADLNFDSKVNIIDFSILLYFWEQTKPSNKCADINFDRRVDIIDFSIMMYQWTE